MTDFTGAGDPARSLAVLWRIGTPPTRGPKPGLDIDQIVMAAIALADADGLSTLSMRRVAEKLGVGTMSLYTYVPSKAELLDAMLDLTCAETARPRHGGGGWRDGLEQIARENWAVYQRHPWLLQLATSRPPLGPHVTAKYDYELSAIEGIGLTDIEMDTIIGLILGHAETAARRAAESTQLSQRTHLTDEQWWKANAPLLEQVFDPTRFPVAARVGAAAGQAYNAAGDPEQAFEFGLRRLLDGIETLINARSHLGPDRAP